VSTIICMPFLWLFFF